MLEPHLKANLDYLGLKNLGDSWEDVMASAQKLKPSYHRFLCDILKQEVLHKSEGRRLARLKAAKIPEMLVMETFPFANQPRLNRKKVMGLYDSLDYMHQKQFLLLVGPTGCGKSGLATAYLMHAINNGFKGLFIDFRELITELYRAGADFSEKSALRKFISIDCLLIDEVGYRPVNKDEAGLFFELLKKRHKAACTLITTQRGFEEWDKFMADKHLTAALADRITENCTVFNMQECISLRKKNIRYATD